VEHWDAELVLDAHAELGEGPVWDDRTGALVWVDIMAGRVHLFDPAGGADRVIAAGRPVGAVALRASGGYVLARDDGFAVTGEGEVELLAPVEVDVATNRMNDGACDSRGRFWAGTMHLDCVTCTGSLYRLEVDHSVTRVLSGVTISNGIGWSPDDRTMYFVDTPTGGVDAFDYEPEAGTIENRRRLVTIEAGAGTPDGLTVDAEGTVWVALWGGSSVRRYAADGALLGDVSLPVTNVTKPAFGGAELDDLYITTAAPDRPGDDEPHAGGLFRVRPGVRGLPAARYRG
jgi:sugar lactone lactonase YvrE